MSQERWHYDGSQYKGKETAAPIRFLLVSSFIPQTPDERGVYSTYLGENVLAQYGAVRRAEPQNAIEIARGDTPNVIILDDWQDTPYEGEPASTELVRGLKEAVPGVRIFLDCPTRLGSGGIQMQRQAFKAGVADCLTRYYSAELSLQEYQQAGIIPA